MAEERQESAAACEGWDELKRVLTHAARDRRVHGLERTLSPPHPGLIDLSHNDYLGLRTDQAFQARCRDALAALPVGAGASRLLGGEWPIYAELEKKAAHWKGAESALYFNSGYAANEAVFRALQSSGARFFSDALNHASMIDGLRLAKIPREDLVVFPHGDLEALDKALLESPARYNVIAVESVYSMDGNAYPLAELFALAARRRGILVVDEAHALGVFGKEGEGLAAAAGLDPRQVISVNPCGKALAASGAFICGPQWLREHLINTARSFIFSTGPSPWVAAALSLAVDHVRGAHRERERLSALSQDVRTHAQALGFDTRESSSPIVPIILGDNASALAAADILFKHGIYTRAIRPPTVPEGTARLRLSLHAALTDKGMAVILDALTKVRETLCAFS